MPGIASRQDACSAPQWYQFHDVRLCLSARRQGVLEEFGRRYGAFRSANVAAPPHDDVTPLDCFVDTDSGGRGCLVLGDNLHYMTTDDPDGAYASAVIFDRVAACSRSHLFLHAAAVSVGGRALLLCGHSGHGKSTLSQALVERGAVLLCDDVAPIDTVCGTVTSFHAPASAVVPVAAVALLHSPCSQHLLHLALDRVPAQWEHRGPWGEQSGVVLRRADHCWELIAEAPASGLVEEIEQACRAAGVVVLRDLGREAPSFLQVPSLVPLPLEKAIPMLASHLFGRGGNTLTDLAFRLTGSLKQACFWQLTLGLPEATAEALLDMLDGAPR